MQNMTLWSLTLRDLVVTGLSLGFLFEVELFDTIMVLLIDYPECKIASKQLSKSLSALLVSRPFREHVSPDQFQKLIDFCIDFFLSETLEKENTLLLADRRAECLDLATCFCLMITCDSYKNDVMQHNSVILKFISKYLSSYSTETPSFELFLTAALRILLIMDVNDLDFSIKFLKAMLWKLLEFLKSKSESMRLCVVNLLRLYISIGARCVNHHEDSSKTSFVYSTNRIQKEIFVIIESSHTHLTLENVHRIFDSNPREQVKEPFSFSKSLLSLASDLGWLSVQSSEIDNLESLSPTQDSEDGPRKRVKLNASKNDILSLLTSSKIHHNVSGAQIVGIMIVRHSHITLNVASLFGQYLMAFIFSHDTLLSRSSCYVLAQMVENGCIDLENERMWKCCIGMLKAAQVDTKTPRVSSGPFVLLKSLLSKKLAPTERIVDLMNIVLTLHPVFINQDAINCIKQLLHFSNLWDRAAVASLIKKVAFCIDYYSTESQYDHCYMLLAIFESILEIPATIDSNHPNWIQPLALPPPIGAKRIFDFIFDGLEARIQNSLGLNGTGLATMLFDEKKESTVKYTLNQTRMNLLLDQFEEYLAIIIANEVKVAADAAGDFVRMLSILNLLQRCPDIDTARIMSSLELCAVKCFGNIHYLNSEEFKAILNPFCINQTSKHLFWPLSFAKTDKILSVLDSQRVAMKSDDIMDEFNGKRSYIPGRIIDLMLLSFFGDTINLDAGKNYHQTLILYFRLVDSMDDQESMRKRAMKTLKEAFDTRSDIDKHLFVSQSWDTIVPFLTQGTLN